MAHPKNVCNRREFFSKTLSGMTSVGIFSLSSRKWPWFSQEKSIEKKGGNVICRTLGKTGIRMPIVNMGVMNNYDPALVKRSYEIGVRHFDTAAHYRRGLNEEMLGKIFQEMGVRDKVIIGTKIFIPHQERGMSPDRIKEMYLKTAEESLKRLRTDSVDILYSHNVSTLEYLNNPGVLEALAILKKQKKARYVGFSTHTNMAQCISEAVRTGFYDVILTSINYSMSDDKVLMDTMQNAASKGIGLIAMKTQCRQPWYMKQNEPAEKHTFYEGEIMHTALLKWVLHHEFITSAVPGYTNYQQMEEDFSVAYDISYTPEEKKFLEDRNVKLSMAFCQQCSRCIPTCPGSVDIPALIRTHMYAACYGNFFQARDTLLDIPRGKGLDVCMRCTSCRAKCIRRVDIPERIDILKSIYA